MKLGGLSIARKPHHFDGAFFMLPKLDYRIFAHNLLTCHNCSENCEIE